MERYLHGYKGTFVQSYMNLFANNVPLIIPVQKLEMSGAADLTVLVAESSIEVVAPIA